MDALAMGEDRDGMAERLRRARAQQYGSPSEAARALGIPEPTYLAHENGSRGYRATASRYADFFRVRLEWLLTGRGPMRNGDEGAKRGYPAPMEIDSAQYTAIGRFDASFSMGPGSLIAERPEPMGYWLIETQWLHAMTRAAPENLAVVRVDGDSMIPTLNDGDWVLIDKTQVRLSREGIYAIMVRDDAWVKRLSLNLRDKKIRIISDNTTIPVQDVDESDLAVIGRVISLVARKIG